MYCSLYCLYDSRGTIYILSIDSRALAHFSLRLVRLIQFSRRDKHTEYRVESTSVFFTTACFDAVLLVARRGCKMDLTTSSHRLRRTIFPSRNTQHYSIVQSPDSRVEFSPSLLDTCSASTVEYVVRRTLENYLRVLNSFLLSTSHNHIHNSHLLSKHNSTWNNIEVPIRSGNATTMNHQGERNIGSGHKERWRKIMKTREEMQTRTLQDTITIK